MNRDINWREAVKIAEHYLAIGQSEVYLGGDNTTDYPWDFCISVEPGGSHRLDIDTSVWFRGSHPSGLEFRWSFHIEPHSANGTGSYQIDTVGCERVIGLLPDRRVRLDFREYLARCAVSVREHAEKQAAYVTRQLGDAAVLERLARHEPAAESEAPS